MALFLVGNGTFNGISTWIESIVRPRGFTPAQAGVLGGLLLLGAIVGAAILPALSDRAHKRAPNLSSFRRIKVRVIISLLLAGIRSKVTDGNKADPY